ncbi:MAG TPA: GNAT family N-acetyltransferase [Puia sp.]|nr:GNAT family N-acetyltransferase [Puia sp.]
MIPNEGIAENLYSLYGGLAETGLVASGRAGGFEYVSHEGFAWPNMAYRPGRSGPAGREEIRLLKESMAAGDCPRLVLFDGTGMTGEVEGLLAAERFIGATEWVNMYLPAGQPEVAGQREVIQPVVAGQRDLLSCRTIDADDPREWDRWASIVSGVLFRNMPLDPLLFRQASVRTRFSLMTAYSDGEAVAACLVYFGENAGLYMVATLPGFQGKGFGGRLMEHARSAAAARGYGSVVLHSTKAGLHFYKRLGFTSTGKLLLYYSMP